MACRRRHFGASIFIILGLGFCAQSTVTTSYICPHKFTQIGRKCYHFGEDEVNWHDAHYRCLSLNSTLAIVTRSHQESQIREYLNTNSEDLGLHERWLGGIFNEKQSKWLWGATGKPLGFHAFSRMDSRDKTKWIWHCIVIDPERQNKWGAESCLKKNRYVCQTQSNKYMSVKSNLKEEFTRNGCDLEKLEGYEKELCSKIKYGESAPGYLVRKTEGKKKRKRPRKAKFKEFICPAHMIIVGRKCYFFSTDSANWNDAYWACRDNKTKLATINNKLEDNILRGFLNANFVEKHERWIGGIFDWKQNKWKWAMTGQELKYKNFANAGGENMDNVQHCITMDPQFKHEWGSVNRMESRHYICQAKPKILVKYGKPQKLEPDATVVIQIENNTVDLKSKRSAPFTTETNNLDRIYGRNHITSTEKYVFN